MKDFSLFDIALKLNWVKRLCSNSDAPWQYIPKSLLAELFKCNYDYNKTEVLSQPIWNNRFLTVNKKMVFSPHRYQAGIKQISTYLTPVRVTSFLILFAINLM